MSENDNPFKSPASAESQHSSVGVSRRAGGVLAYFMAACCGVAGVLRIGMLVQEIEYTSSSGEELPYAIETIAACSLTAALVFSGWRLRARNQGSVEWLVLALCLLLPVVWSSFQRWP